MKNEEGGKHVKFIQKYPTTVFKIPQSDWSRKNNRFTFHTFYSDNVTHSLVESDCVFLNIVI